MSTRERLLRHPEAQGVASRHASRSIRFVRRTSLYRLRKVKVLSLANSKEVLASRIISPTSADPDDSSLEASSPAIAVRFVEALSLPPLDIVFDEIAAPASSQSAGFDAIGRLDSGFGELIGSSRRALEIIEALNGVAHANVSSLIEGATGTGKALVAQSPHRASLCVRGPYVLFDCGSPP